MTQMDTTRAVGVLNAAMQHGMISEGAIPEGDGDKVVEAGKLVDLAHQWKAVADQVGPANITGGLDAFQAIKDVLAAAGEQEQTPAAPAPEAASTPEQPPVAVAPPSPELIEAAGPGTAHNPVPGSEAASRPQNESGAHVPPPEAPAPAPAAPTAAEEPVGYPVTGEVWADAGDGQWELTRGEGGPQVEARIVGTEEATVLPSGFLKRRISAAPTTPKEEPSTTPSSPAPASSPEPASSSASAPQPDAQPAPSGPPPVTLTAGGSQQAASSPSAPSASAGSPEPSGMDVFTDVELTVGEVRQGGDGNAYRLQSIDSETQVTIVPVAGGAGAAIPLDGWKLAPLVEQAVVPEAVQEIMAPHIDTAPTATEAASAPAPASGDRAAAQALPAPVDDDEGDEEYAKLLDQVTADYTPTGMPAPMDLEREPSAMPDDLTAVTDMEERRLHSQFNALASRSRYLHGLEAAKARACARLRDYRLGAHIPAARGELGKSASLEEVRQLASQHDDVQEWIRREVRHSERATAYKTFLSFYTEDVTVLSRDWTMRTNEEQGS